jgi:branched-chain amino acid transport system permease protein
MSSAAGVLIDLMNGCASGMLYFLIASALTLIFGVLGIFNFAHGTFFMIGAYMTWTLINILGNVTWGFWLAILFSAILVGLLASVIEVSILRRLYKEDPVYQFLLFFGLVLFLDGACLIIWGPSNKGISLPSIISGSWIVAGMSFPVYYMFIIFVSVLIYAILCWFLYRTNLGKTSRASAMDREMSEALGINVPAVFTAVFYIGVAIAGLCGGLACGMRALAPGLDLDVIMTCFAIVIIGGVGSLKGAFVAALLLGILQSFTGHYFQVIAMAIPYIFLAGVLLWRPQGLFGKR